MAAKTRIQIARSDILRYFDGLGERVFRRSDIARHLAGNRAAWRLTQDLRIAEFIDFLTKSGRLRVTEFAFRPPYKKEVRYTWGRVPRHEILLSLKPDSYFSHYTAVQMHGLTEQVPKTTYLNFEQPSQSIPTAELSQHNIDAAFKRKPRISNYVAELEGFRICILNGKNTGNLGVVEQSIREGDESVTVRLTNIERTLIDIAVRPAYAGGVGEVAKAYEIARDRASINRLAAMLKQIGHIYPYHQAVGFYLERAGYKPAAIDILRSLPREFDFYLAHQLGATDYVKQWRLYVPKGF